MPPLLAGDPVLLLVDPVLLAGVHLLLQAADLLAGRLPPVSLLAQQQLAVLRLPLDEDHQQIRSLQLVDLIFIIVR